ncbi:MAG: hypothetical protein J7L92_04155, partial [Dehalococcoidia bacterium]|nr:hypothetical protein [Dehalococcoidia bacterium]
PVQSPQRASRLIRFVHFILRFLQVNESSQCPAQKPYHLNGMSAEYITINDINARIGGLLESKLLKHSWIAPLCSVVQIFAI